jgi:hypothetical protein
MWGILANLCVVGILYILDACNVNMPLFMRHDTPPDLSDETMSAIMEGVWEPVYAWKGTFLPSTFLFFCLGFPFIRQEIFPLECDPNIDASIPFDANFDKDCLIDGMPQWCVITLLMWACMGLVMMVFTMKWGRSIAADESVTKALLNGEGKGES